ncbi:MAG: class I SAM-dependent methyltransferase [Solirubrobacteraceae bacterium]
MTAPAPELVASAQRDSPLRDGAPFTAAADHEELSFREDIEPYPEPLRDVPRFIESKRLPEYLQRVLERTGIVPQGVVIELGAGVCWLAAALARNPAVSRVVAVEFSRRRLADLAPIAIAHLDAPAGKVERVIADFHAPGLPAGSADLVVCDAAFHHAADPRRLAVVAHEVLRPGGALLLMREPTVTRLRRARDHGLEGEHGDFEREYSRSEYLAFLRGAGFDARSAAAPGNLASRRGRAVLRPPFSWLNGIVFSEYAYVGRKLDQEAS